MCITPRLVTRIRTQQLHDDSLFQSPMQADPSQDTQPTTQRQIKTQQLSKRPNQSLHGNKGLEDKMNDLLVKLQESEVNANLNLDSTPVIRHGSSTIKHTYDEGRDTLYEDTDRNL